MIFDHDKMSKLFKEDPEQFEKEYRDQVEALILSAPVRLQPKLRAIQKLWDQEMEHMNSQQRLYLAKVILAEHLRDAFNPTLDWATKKLSGELIEH